MARKNATRTPDGKFTKGVNDSSFGQQSTQGAASPKAIKNSVASLTPIEAYQISTPVRVCINARNNPFSQIKIRLFDKNENEILSGPEFDFCQHPNNFESGNDFITNIACFDDLTDERHVWINNKDGLSAHVLNPMNMRVMEPTYPKLPEEIKKWQYIWTQGVVQSFLSDQIVYEHEFNPASPVRGLSKLYAILNDIDSEYRSTRWIRAFFLNSAIPASIIHVATDNPDLVEPFKKELESALQGEANAFRNLFSYGNEKSKVDIQPLEQPMKEGVFLELQKAVQRKTAALYLTPPIVSGQWDAVRFDSASEQTDVFYGGTFLPRCDKINRYFQKVLDRAFPIKLSGRKEKIKMSPSFRARYNKTRSETQGDIVVIFDTDHIPEVARLKQHKVDYAEKLMKVFKMTPEDAALEVDIDLDLNAAAKLVWFDSNQKYISTVEAEALNASKKQEVIQPEVKPQEPIEEDVSVDSEAVDNAKQFFRALRKLTLEHLDTKTAWKLSDADSLAKTHNCYSPVLYVEIRKAFHVLTPLIKKQDKENIKAYFSNFKNRDYRIIAKGINDGK